MAHRGDRNQTKTFCWFVFSHFGTKLGKKCVKIFLQFQFLEKVSGSSHYGPITQKKLYRFFKFTFLECGEGGFPATPNREIFRYTQSGTFDLKSNQHLHPHREFSRSAHEARVFGVEIVIFPEIDCACFNVENLTSNICWHNSNSNQKDTNEEI